MKHLYNVHSLLGKPIDISTYTSKGLVIGRPQPIGLSSIDELEKDGWIGVYDPLETPSNIVKMLGPNGPIDVDIGPGQQIDANRQPPVPVIVDIDLNVVKSSEYIKDDVLASNLDDRIKEAQRTSPAKNPTKYRARWAGTRYVYDRID